MLANSSSLTSCICLCRLCALACDGEQHLPASTAMCRELTTVKPQNQSTAGAGMFADGEEQPHCCTCNRQQHPPSIFNCHVS
jgi:hypothetical protein